MNFITRRCCSWVGIGCCSLVFLIVGCDKATVENAKNEAKNAAADAQQAATDAQTSARDAAQAAGQKAGEMKDAIGEEFSGAYDKAAAALKDFDGGSELLSGMKESFASAKQSLTNVTDSASADAARDKLAELGTKFEGMSEQLKKLPAEAKPAVEGMINQGIEMLHSLADKAMSVPGVKDKLVPAIDQLKEKLQAMIGSEPKA